MFNFLYNFIVNYNNWCILDMVHFAQLHCISDEWGDIEFKNVYFTSDSCVICGKDSNVKMCYIN